MKTNIGRLRIIGFLEGVSLLVLFGIAMPLKYMWDSPEAVRIFGMVHGLLFIAYIIQLAVVVQTLSWNLKEAGMSFVASFLPFGTFMADAKIFKKYTPLK